MTLFTIGFTRTSAQGFFDRLQGAGVRRVIDTRLNRVSQLSGFAKQDDLAFFLQRLASIDYAIEALLAPTADLFKAYRDREVGWDEYARRYLDLIRERRIETRVDAGALDRACLLCSEAKPDHCHRRLAAEYLADCGTVEIVHL